MLVVNKYMNVDIKPHAIEILKKAGIKRGQFVLDFGCGFGTYTIPAAKIVGSTGMVYALDKDKESLDKLMQKARSESLKNIERMETSGKLPIELDDESLDVVLLFDVFHSFYFPNETDRSVLLGEINRVIKQKGRVSVWPKHMESEAEVELKNADFRLEKRISGVLIHENRDIERGDVLNFRKTVRHNGK